MTDEERIRQLATHYEAILRLVGEDPHREGLKDTPARAAKAMMYITRGYRQDIDGVIHGAMFEAPSSGMIVVKDIEFYSLCEHHLLPFFGHVSIGYIPDGKIIGLSKLARIVDVFARRFQVQERFTAELCATLTEKLNAKGVIVQTSARHLCMQMRGVEKQESNTVTTLWSGIFDTDLNLRSQFFQ